VDGRFGSFCDISVALKDVCSCGNSRHSAASLRLSQQVHHQRSPIAALHELLPTGVGSGAAHLNKQNHQELLAPCHYAFRSVLPSRETQIKFGCFSQQATWNLASQKMIEAREKADRVAKPRALAMTRATSFGSRATLAACASPARNTCCTHAYDMGCLAAEYAAWFPRSQCDKGQVQ
jgi:hypothetical protein